MRRLLIAAMSLALAGAPALADDIDLHHLPVGDTRHSTEPKAGYIWPCHVEPGAGGAFRDGPWMNGDGTFDITKKPVVEGEQTWPHRYAVARVGDRRVFKTNDLPDHATGAFPIQPGTAAYDYDRNPNSIRTQDFDFDLPADPVLANHPSCAPGAIGVLTSGVVLFNALDAPGRDALAHEIQDHCQGHPQPTGVYHYHSISTCLPDKRLANGHSSLMGYAIDGFGIFGRYGDGGKALTSADLDECHGHVGLIPWDGKMVMMYHYHATADFPYTAGCLKGRWSQEVVRKISGGPPPRMGGGPGFGPPPGF